MGCSEGALAETITCTQTASTSNPCTVPTNVDNAHLDGVCGVTDGVTVSQILDGEVCTVHCLAEFTANVATTACSEGALAETITCTQTATTPTCDCSAAGRLLQSSADVSVGYTIIADAATLADIEATFVDVTTADVMSSVEDAVTAAVTAGTITTAIEITSATAPVLLAVVTAAPAPAVGDGDDDEDFALKSGCPLLGLILVAAATRA